MIQNFFPCNCVFGQGRSAFRVFMDDENQLFVLQRNAFKVVCIIIITEHKLEHTFFELFQQILYTSGMPNVDGYANFGMLLVDVSAYLRYEV